MEQDASPETNQNTRSWWSWAPEFPKWAILTAALVYDLIVVGLIRYNYLKIENEPVTNLPRVIEATIQGDIVASAAALLFFIQLNAEVIKMILTLKRNYMNVVRAAAQGRAEGRDEGKAEAHQAAREWYEANKHDLQNAPPPPFIADPGAGGNNGAHPGSGQE